MELNQRINKNFSHMLTDLKTRVEKAVEAFKGGHGVLIADDGIRENEIDFVFHAERASDEIVNLAIQEARGLMCVALSAELADKLSLPQAPQSPGEISHTAFTLSVDARHGITSGISARDRAVTVRLLGQEKANPGDFITPGHVFPLRARKYGLLERTGHTEASIELCKIAGVSEAAVITEVLDTRGEPIRPKSLKQSHSGLKEFVFVTTADLLWYQIIFNRLWDRTFFIDTTSQGCKFLFEAENQITSECILRNYTPNTQINPETLSISFQNGFESVSNDVSKIETSLVIFDGEDDFTPIGHTIESFCDLSRKEGLRKVQPSMRRFVTLMKALTSLSPLDATVGWFSKIHFPIAADKELMLEIFRLKARN